MNEDEKPGAESAAPGTETSEKPEAAGQETAPEIDPVAELTAQVEELKDQRLRLAAEMENMRRRTERDVKDARTFSIAGFARDMLQVSDNLRRALDAVPEGENGEAVLKTLIEGVELTERSMISALEKHGVRKIDPKGQKFDPNFHQAMFEIPNTEVANGTVMEVVQAGYVIGERMLRPALVGVAKGGPKEMPAAEPGPPIPESEKDA